MNSWNVDIPDNLSLHVATEKCNHDESLRWHHLTEICHHRIINCFNMLQKILQPNQRVILSVLSVICAAHLMRTQVWFSWPKHFTASSRPFKTNYFLSSCTACPGHLDRVDCFQCNNIQCSPKVWKRSRQSGVLDSIWIHQHKFLLFSDGFTLIRDNTNYKNIFYLIKKDIYKSNYVLIGLLSTKVFWQSINKAIKLC